MHEIFARSRIATHTMDRLQRPVHGALRLLAVATLTCTLLALGKTASAGPASAATSPIVALAFDPASSALLKATVKTLSRSSDGGRTWTPVALPAEVKGNISSIALSPRNPQALYVAISGHGILRSRDGGRNWHAQAKGLPVQKVAALTAHADQAETVYAYVKKKGVFRSQDGGASWRLMDRGQRDPIVALVHSNMAGSMESGWLFAATPDGMRRSMDCFCGWHRAGEVKGSFHAVSFDRAAPERVYAASRKGLFASSDGGEKWTAMKSPAALVTAMVTSTPSEIYAAAGGKLFRTRDRGVSWESTDG